MNQWWQRTTPRLLLDQHLRVKRASSSLCQACGMGARFLIGTRIDDWVNLDAEFLQNLRQRLARGGAAWRQKFTLRLPGFPLLMASVILRPVRGRRGAHLLVTLCDIRSPSG